MIAILTVMCGGGGVRSVVGDRTGQRELAACACSITYSIRACVLAR